MVVQIVGLAVVLFLLLPAASDSQERIKIAYSSADASNTVWFTALDAGLYKKHGLDVELVFIQSSTMSVSTLVSGDIQIANSFGRRSGECSRWRSQLGDDRVLHQYTALRTGGSGVGQIDRRP